MTIEASRLRIDLQKREHWRRTLSVTVPAELVRREREKVAARLAKRLKIPGFRPGRIPAAEVEKRLGGRVQQETLDALIREAYQEALRVEALRPISEGEVESVDYEPEKDLSFSVSFDVQPEIELARLGSFRVSRPRADAGDEEVDRVLRRLREQAGTWRPEESGTPADGDRVAVTVVRLGEEGEGDPREYELVLGQGDALPDVERAIASLEPGQSGEFTIGLPPDADSPEGSAPEAQLLRITLRERSVRELPELDDAFARSVGDFADLETLRSRVLEDLRREAAAQAETVVRGRLLDLVVEANPFDVPRSMTDRYLDSLLGDTEGADPERLARVREQLRPEAERAVRRVLVIEHVATAQGLRATESDLDERIERIATQNEISPSQVYAQLQKAGRLESMEREITEDKVFAFLGERSEITEDEG